MEYDGLVVKHRSSFEIHPLSSEVDTLGEAANLVVGWLLNKESRWDGSPAMADFEAQGGPVFWDYSMPEDYAGGLQDDFWPALATASTADESGDATSWVLEYDEPDATYEGRRWHTLVSLERLADDGCHIGVESTCRDTEGDPDGVAPSLAALPFSRDLLEIEGCRACVGSTPLEPTVARLTAETFGAFAEQVADPERILPLVVFCTNSTFGTAEYAKQLARRTIAVANVYIVNHEDPDLWAVAQPFLSGEGAPLTPEEVPCRIYLANGVVEEPELRLFREYRPSSFASRIGRAFLYSEAIPTVAVKRAAAAGNEEQTGAAAEGILEKGAGEAEGAPAETSEEAVLAEEAGEEAMPTEGGAGAMPADEALAESAQIEEDKSITDDPQV